jgi:hypothetical protein
MSGRVEVRPFSKNFPKIQKRGCPSPSDTLGGFFIAHADSQRKFTLRLDIYTNYCIMRNEGGG